MGAHPPGGHEPEPDRLVTEELVLDIGGTVGALIVHADAEWRGHEVEVLREGGGEQAGMRIHTVVREIRIGGQRRFAGVFPELGEGAWQILDAGAGRPDRATIRGGEVTEVDWRRGP